jgi:hypothetical protein
MIDLYRRRLRLGRNVVRGGPESRAARSVIGHVSCGIEDVAWRLVGARMGPNAGGGGPKAGLWGGAGLRRISHGARARGFCGDAGGGEDDGRGRVGAGDGADEDDRRSPAACLGDVPRFLANLDRRSLRTTPVDFFAAVFYAVFDSARGRLTYCIAGYPLPARWLWPGGGSGSVPQVRSPLAEMVRSWPRSIDGRGRLARWNSRRAIVYHGPPTASRACWTGTGTDSGRHGSSRRQRLAKNARFIRYAKRSATRRLRLGAGNRGRMIERRRSSSIGRAAGRATRRAWWR